MKAQGVLWILLELLWWPEPVTGESTGRDLGGGVLALFNPSGARLQLPANCHSGTSHVPSPIESRKGCQGGELGT